MKQNKVSRILSGIDKAVVRLDEAALAERGKADSIRAKANEAYSMPDKAMKHARKIIDAINSMVMDFNRKAFAKAQELSRKAGEHDAVADRAERVSEKFANLIK